MENSTIFDRGRQSGDPGDHRDITDGRGISGGAGERRHDGAGTVKRAGIDLIILDIMMPGMNGYQTCLEIRKMSNAPILFLSARTKDSDKTLGFSSGGDDYLPKPFSYNELLNRVKA